MNSSNRNIEKYFDGIIGNPKKVILLVIVILAFLAFQLPSLKFDSNYKIYFGESNPDLLTYEYLQDTYTTDDNLIFIVAPVNGSVFSDDSISVISKITEKAWELPYSRRVDSITNFQHTKVEGDELVVSDLLEAVGKINSNYDYDLMKEIALNQPELVDKLINKKGNVAAIGVTLMLPQKSMDEAPIVAQAARQLKEEVGRSHPNVRIYLTGTAMLNNAFVEASKKDLSTLTPLMYLLIIFVTYLVIRSVSGTIATFFVIVGSTIVAMGVSSLMKLNLSPQSAVVPTIITTLAVADSIHILVSYSQKIQEGLRKNNALKKSLVQNFSPVLLTSLTTALGFLSMNFCDSPPLAEMGNVSAIGIFAALFLSYTLLPALVVVFPTKPSKFKAQGNQLWLDRLSDFLLQHRRSLFAASMVVSLVFLVSIPKNELNDELAEYFDDSTEFSKGTHFSEENISGLGLLHIELDTNDENGISNPEYLQLVEKFSAWLEKQPKVDHVKNISTIFKRLNKNMNFGSSDEYQLPSSRELASQYLLLYELSLPYGLDLSDIVNHNKSASRISITLNSINSSELNSLVERSEDWLKLNNTKDIDVEIGGANLMFARLANRTLSNMLYGMVLSLIGISFLLGIVFKSLRIALVTLVPNLLPIGVAFGMWGLLNGQIGFNLATVMGMTLGIVVDDTIHFVSKFRYLIESGLSHDKALRKTISGVGEAIIATSLILLTGFSVLSTSSFQGNSAMALLSCLAILSALLIVFLTLPFLAKYMVKPDKRDQNNREKGGLLLEPVAVSCQSEVLGNN